MINFDERRPKSLSEKMEAIDVDAAARGGAHLLTGLTGTEKIDYTFSLIKDVEEFYKQQELSVKTVDKLRKNPVYRAEVESLDAILQEMQDGYNDK